MIRFDDWQLVHKLQIQEASRISRLVFYKPYLKQPAQIKEIKPMDVIIGTPGEIKHLFTIVKGLNKEKNQIMGNKSRAEVRQNPNFQEVAKSLHLNNQLLHNARQAFETRTNGYLLPGGSINKLV